MAKVRSWVGLDVHVRSVLAVSIDGESGELSSRRLSGITADVVEFCSSLPGPTRVAYEAGPTVGQSDIWVLDLARGLSTRVTSSDSAWPRWSPDGKHVYYSNANGIHRKAADGSGEEEWLLKGGVNDLVNSVSPDGNHLLYGRDDLLMLPLKGARKPQAYLQTRDLEFGGTFSPDGPSLPTSRSKFGGCAGE